MGSDPKGWLQAQVMGSRPAPEALLPLPDSADIFKVFTEGRGQARDNAKRACTGNSAAQQIARNIRREIVPLYLEQVAARYTVAVNSAESLRERLVHFWSNHFAVSADKPQVIALAATLENEAIRPTLDHGFTDMLLAVESHPAMILYLDNQASIGPHSQLAQRAARRSRNNRKLDINENLAREIF